VTRYGVLGSLGASRLKTANADLVMKRLWTDTETASDGRLEDLKRVRAAAAEVPPGHLTALHARRAAAVQTLCARHAKPRVARAIDIIPMWRLVLGHGEDSVHESGLSMSPTYGVPVIPGSGLKGIASRMAGTTDLTRVFGSPRPRPEKTDEAAGGEASPEPMGSEEKIAERGTVVIMDALPLTPPRLVVDVLTPHVTPYYRYFQGDKAGAGEPPVPAECRQPVPVRFLAVYKTTFRAWLLGPPDDVTLLIGWLTDAADDLGLGGKTAAGYGYCTISEPAGGDQR
jgi:CRISPR-associated protein Cmr6